MLYAIMAALREYPFECYFKDSLLVLEFSSITTDFLSIVSARHIFVCLGGIRIIKNDSATIAIQFSLLSAEKSATLARLFLAI